MTTILVMEDVPELRENILETLEIEGFQVIGVEDGVSGVRLVREQRPDLIICDIRMPGLDGYGVLEALSQDPATASIPLIFLSGKVDKASIQRGLEQGAVAYLTKPFEPTELLDVVYKWLGK